KLIAGSSARSHPSRISDATPTRATTPGTASEASAYDGSAMKNQLIGIITGTRSSHIGASISLYAYAPNGTPHVVPASSLPRLIAYMTTNAGTQRTPVRSVSTSASTAIASHTWPSAKNPNDLE